MIRREYLVFLSEISESLAQTFLQGYGIVHLSLPDGVGSLKYLG